MTSTHNAPVIDATLSMILDDGPRTGTASRVADFVHRPTRIPIAELLLSTGAYFVDMALPVAKWFTWKSGIKAPCYCNCRKLEGFPVARRAVVEGLASSIRTSSPDAQLIVGMATAGISWARGVADSIGLPFAYVRSAPKTHGVGRLVQCDPSREVKAVLIDDLIASGESLRAGIQALATEAQIQTIGIHSIVNWGFDEMRTVLDGVRYKSLTSYPYILALALTHGLIGPEDYGSLLRFYEDPKTCFADA